MAEPLSVELDQKAQSLAASLRFSVQGRMRTSHTERIWKYRKYTGGEPASTIDWKQSGRGNQIYVREHEPILHPPIFFWLQSDLPSDVDASVLLILLSTAYILVEKERTVGWLMPGLPRSTTRSQLFPLFSKSLGSLKQEQKSTPSTFDLHKAFIIFAGDFHKDSEATCEALRAYTAQGNRGLLLQLGEKLDPSHNAAATAAWKSGWPVVTASPSIRPDTSIAQMLDQIVLATR